MRIQIEGVTAWSLLFCFVVFVIIGFILGGAITYHTMQEKVTAAEAAATTATNLLTRAGCPENVFQEKTIMLPDGGVYKCGAVRTIPVNQRELNKWYKAEAKLLLKKKGKK